MHESIKKDLKTVPLEPWKKRKERAEVKTYSKSRGWSGSADWTSACQMKGRWFNSLSGHMPELQVRSPAGVTQESTTH